MYNLFVSGRAGEWQGKPFDTDLSRFKQFTRAEILEQFGNLDKYSVEKLKKFPCIFAYETMRNTIPPLFEHTVKRMATTLARKFWYDLKDFASAEELGIQHFTLILERRNIDGQEQWWGTFSHHTKNLKVIGTLERARIPSVFLQLSF
ncbi:MAG: hypothetical protein GY804_09545 [Alphaproteobacteria bacterium]|nr:hypothetical protein [Alphaproteobacteria bacterium]